MRQKEYWKGAWRKFWGGGREYENSGQGHAKWKITLRMVEEGMRRWKSLWGKKREEKNNFKREQRGTL